jgi:hypothetical protein
MWKRRLAAKTLAQAFWALFSAFLILVIFQAISWEAQRDDYSTFAFGFLSAVGIFTALALSSLLIKRKAKVRTGCL